MMQIVRCESAVAQGLRSVTLQATKMAESASMLTLIPFIPFGLLIVDLSPLKPASPPSAPKFSIIFGSMRDFCLLD